MITIEKSIHHLWVKNVVTLTAFLLADCHAPGASKKTDSAVSYPSREIFLYTQKRQLGFVQPSTVVNDYVSQRMPLLLSEKEFKMGKIDKIFTSQWLNHKQVVFGTKCNKVSTYSDILNMNCLT